MHSEEEEEEKKKGPNTSESDILHQVDTPEMKVCCAVFLLAQEKGQVFFLMLYLHLLFTVSATVSSTITGLCLLITTSFRASFRIECAQFTARSPVKVSAFPHH